MKTAHTVTCPNLETSKAEKEVSFGDDEFNTSPDISNSDDALKDIKMKDLSKLVQNVKVHLEVPKETEDALGSHPPSPSQVSSVQAKIKTLDALLSLLNKVTTALDRFVKAIEDASQQAGDKSVPSAGQAGTHPAEGEKNTTQVAITQL
ncbi:hypothetical protein Tco_1095378, partial [Tanacetum coccineum]